MEINTLINELELIKEELENNNLESLFVNCKTLYNNLQSEKQLTIRLMKSVHIANNFRNDFLKQSSYLLDEIIMYLEKDGILKKGEVHTLENIKLMKRLKEEGGFTSSPTYEKESVLSLVNTLLEVLNKKDD